MKTFNVLLQIDTSRITGRALIRGIIRYTQLYGPWNFYSDLSFFSKIGLTYDCNWETLKPDGIFVHTPDKRLIKKIIKSNIPAILHGFNNVIEELPNLICDNAMIAEFGADHLLGRGFCNLAYCGYRNVQWSQERQDVFETLASKAGCQSYVYQSPDNISINSWQQEQDSLAQWIRSLPKPVGIMCANDDRGQQVIEICNALGILVPDEAAVVGVDNEEFICELTNPPLSSVDRHFVKAGYQAAELLHRMMQGKQAEKQDIIIEPSRVVERQSTDVYSIEDPVVVEALRFIRRNANRIITVDDVVEHVAMSKMGLYQKFMRSVGRTVYNEITRTRIDHIARMLIETELPIDKIALDMGFTSSDHISRYFQQAKGLTPRQYRAKYK